MLPRWSQMRNLLLRLLRFRGKSPPKLQPAVLVREKEGSHRLRADPEHPGQFLWLPVLMIWLSVSVIWPISLQNMKELIINGRIKLLFYSHYYDLYRFD